jgi:hypothetical protein
MALNLPLLRRQPLLRLNSLCRSPRADGKARAFVESVSISGLVIGENLARQSFSVSSVSVISRCLRAGHGLRVAQLVAVCVARQVE